MQSYASPGRVITIVNAGPGAVEVRRDQPYRLGSLIGITQHGAAVDADLNLCVEGMFDQLVDLAVGVEAVEAGSPVHMATDGTWALVAGLTDATRYVPFGVVTERMTRRRVVQVKIVPFAAAVPASGGSGGGEGGGIGSTRSYAWATPTDNEQIGTLSPILLPLRAAAEVVGDAIQFPADETPAGRQYFRVTESGPYRVTHRFSMQWYPHSLGGPPAGRQMASAARVYDVVGGAYQHVDGLPMGDQPTDAGVEASSNGTVYGCHSTILRLTAGQAIGVAVTTYNSRAAIAAGDTVVPDWAWVLSTRGMVIVEKI